MFTKFEKLTTKLSAQSRKSTFTRRQSSRRPGLEMFEAKQLMAADLVCHDFAREDQVDSLPVIVANDEATAESQLPVTEATTSIRSSNDTESSSIDDLVIVNPVSKGGEAFVFFSPADSSTNLGDDANSLPSDGVDQVIGEDHLIGNSTSDSIVGSSGFDWFSGVNLTPTIEVEDLEGGKKISITWFGMTLSGTFQFNKNDGAVAKLEWDGETLNGLVIESHNKGATMTLENSSVKVVIDYFNDGSWKLTISKSVSLDDFTPPGVPVPDAKATGTLTIDFGKGTYEANVTGKYDGIFGETDFDKSVHGSFPVPKGDGTAPAADDTPTRRPHRYWSTPRGELDIRVWTYLDNLGYGQEAKEAWRPDGTDWRGLMEDLGVDIPDWFPRD